MAAVPPAEVPPADAAAWALACWFSVVGLEVVLLASPFSTVAVATDKVEAEDDDADAAEAEAEQDIVGVLELKLVVTVLVEAVVLRVVVRRTTTLVGTAEVDLMVGVTVAEGLVVDTGLWPRWLSTSGLMGVVLVEVPTTLGSGAVAPVGPRGVALATATRGFTWPMAVATGFLGSLGLVRDAADVGADGEDLGAAAGDFGVGTSVF